MKKRTSGRLFTGLIAAAFAVAGAGFATAPAFAETNHEPQTSRFLHQYYGTGINGTQQFYVYMNEGESLHVDAGLLDGRETAGDTWTIGSRAATAKVTDPTGTLLATKEGLGLFDTGRASDVGPLTLTAAATGVYSVTVGASAPKYDQSARPWEIEVSDDAGARIPGRVFVTEYAMIQPTRAFEQDIGFWAVSEYGFQYEITLPEYNGWTSEIRANAFGNVDRDTCLPTYESDLRDLNTTIADAEACGGRYLLFFEEPNVDLPTTATLDAATPLGAGNDNTWVLPELAEPAASNLSFTPDDSSSRAGDLTYTIENHAGVFDLYVDADGDGSFDGPLDRTIPLTTAVNGASYHFDGLDDAGDPLPVGGPVQFKIEISQSPEIHLVLNDVETMAGGIEMKRLNGKLIETDRIYWNDSMFENYPVCSPTPAIINASTDGVLPDDAAQRGWLSTDQVCNDSGSAEQGTWGNQKSLDTWTYGAAQASATTTWGGEADFTLAKSATNGASFKVGEEVTWNFTVKNTGTSPLSNVLIDDPLLDLDDFLCVASLPVNETATCDAPAGYTVVELDATTGEVVNVATADATQGPGIANAPATQTATAKVAVEKTAVTPDPEPKPDPKPQPDPNPEKPITGDKTPTVKPGLANTGGVGYGALIIGGVAVVITGTVLLTKRRSPRE